MGLGGAGLFEEEVASIFFEAPKEENFLLEEATHLSATIEGTLILNLGFFEAGI